MKNVRTPPKDRYRARQPAVPTLIDAGALYQSCMLAAGPERFAHYRVLDAFHSIPHNFGYNSWLRGHGLHNTKGVGKQKAGHIKHDGYAAMYVYTMSGYLAGCQEAWALFRARCSHMCEASMADACSRARDRTAMTCIPRQLCCKALNMLT